MKSIFKNEKTSSHRAQPALHQATAAGPDGISIAPPAYGIESIDRTLAEAAPEPGASIQMKAALSASGGDAGSSPHNKAGLGQQRLLHEAWHVVQQKQKLVKPTIKPNDRIPLNGDATLEKKADFMRVANRIAPGAVAPLTTGKFSDVVQRVPVAADYEAVVGTEIPGLGEARVENYKRHKAAYDVAHGQGAAKQKIDTALVHIFAGLPTPTTFDRDNTNWEAQIDRLFRNVLAHGVANWTYTAGGAHGKPVLLYGSGHCGEFATVFAHAVNLLARWLDVRTLKATTKGEVRTQLTPVISTIGRTAAPGIGPANAMTGVNRPIGNVFAEVNTDADPIDTGYAGVNRAYFQSHGWAKVTMPNGNIKEYDLLMRVDGRGGSIQPALTEADGYKYKRMRNETGALIGPLPAGFDSGIYRIADAVWDNTIEPIVASAQQLADSGLSAEQARQYMAPTTISTLDPEDKQKTRDYMLRLQAIQLAANSVDDMITLAQRTLEQDKIAELWPHLDNAKNIRAGRLTLMLDWTK